MSRFNFKRKWDFADPNTLVTRDDLDDPNNAYMQNLKELLGSVPPADLLVLGTTSTTAKRGDYAPAMDDAPAGTFFRAPLTPGVTNTDPNMARPHSRPDIFFLWKSTVQPAQMLPGDEWDMPA